MFFKLSPIQDKSFPCHFELNDKMWLSCDEGWQLFDCAEFKTIQKGYVLFNDALDWKITCSEPGNALAFKMSHHHDDLIEVISSHLRTTPLFWGEKSRTLTNLPTDSFLEIDFSSKIVLSMTEGLKIDKKDEIGDIFVYQRDEFYVVDDISEILRKTIRALRSSPYPIRIFPSCGIDTTLLLALLIHEQVPFELIDREHFYYDHFCSKHIEQLQGLWAYRQIHHFKQSNILVSGAWGDEFFLRGPLAGWLLLSSLGFTKADVLKPNTYAFEYLQKKQDVFLQRFESDDPVIRYRELMIRLIHDYQHWHLGNTLTFTPYRDLRIPKIMLCLSPSSLLKQYTDGHIQKEIIKLNCPDLLNFISDKKNNNNMTNFRDLIDFVLNKSDDARLIDMKNC